MFRKNIFTTVLGITGCLLALAIASQITHAGQSSSHYKQCFEQTMAGKTGNIAQREAKAACREQFPHTAPQGNELPNEAIQKLKIDAGFGWGIFNGTIYNGNSDYFITQLTVSMTPIHDDHHMEMHANMSHETKEHQIDLNLAPLSKGAISMALTGEDTHVHDFVWEVIQVIGYKTN